MPLLRTLFRLRVEGERPVLGPGGLILAPNHQSWIDPVVVQYAVLPHQITFLMTEIYYEVPIANLYFRAARARPIREAGPSVGALKTALEALASGEIVCIFPEGGITRDGSLQPARRGVARLARRSGAPVLPIGIRGSLGAWSRLEPWPRPHPVVVRLGKPLTYVESEDREGEEAFTARMMGEIGALAYGGNRDIS